MSLADHSYNYLTLSNRSENQLTSSFLEKQATSSQEEGTLFRVKQDDSSSMASDIFRAPVIPNLKSSRVVLISSSRMFILSHSQRHTTTLGFLSLIRELISLTLNSPGSLLRQSIRLLYYQLSLEPPPAPTFPEMFIIVLNTLSHILVKQLISALGCSPNIMGYSAGNLVSMKLLQSAYWNLAGSGDLNYGAKIMLHSNSGLMYTSKQVLLILLSQSSVICPPYMISPKMYFKS